jgi:putative IMPACT (imprinted ancient) family translation regulator
MVVISRWYGGIQLGPDRFKHINNACREILETNGYIKDRNAGTKKKEKKH